MNLDYENSLKKSGWQNICGIDEAGRGPLAGPIVAGAVILTAVDAEFLNLLNDSKLLTEKKREQILPLILKNSLAWAIGVVSAQEIDAKGLSFANQEVMQRAWKFLKIKPDYILSDHVAGWKYELPHEFIIGGDRKIASIAAASIIAKVFRDRMMLAFDKRFPQYGFAKHKGYGTKEHMEKIKESGYCEIHRRSFKIC